MKKEYELQNGKTVVFEYDENRIGKVTVEAMDCLIDMLPKWIPCSERMPERNGYYLVTGRQGAVNKRLYQDGYWYGNWTVFAWMPLPAPYRREGDEKHEG